VSDGCPLFGYDVFVAAIDFQISQSDTDGDGYDPNQGDCDDSDSDIFPQNIEVFDGKDNDCDGVIDEQTKAWDDDGDCFCEVGPCLGSESISCVSIEPDDCNDSAEDLDGNGVADGLEIFPTAVESGNSIDDNCNGITDEGTAFYDDDGDGLTESVPPFDCDDDNDTVFPGAIEWCDGVDNDCDGAIDIPCVEPNTPPIIVGGVITDRFQVELASRVNAQILVVSSEDSLEYVWSSDKGVFDEPANGPSVFWNAPEEDNQVGTFANLLVRVTDSLGQSDTAFGEVLLSRDILVDYAPVTTQPGSGSGCNAAPARTTPTALVLLMGLLGMAAIRRR